MLKCRKLPEKQNPAHAGMNPDITTIKDTMETKPRSRGDEPLAVKASVAEALKTPLTRG